VAASRAADVIIVGAGSVGAPAAMSMAEAGLKVFVLDRLPSVGQGSNKRAIGGLRATHSDPAKIRICLRSLEVFATWEERFGDKIEWHKGGYSYVAYRPEEERTLKDLLAVQKASGLNIDWLDAGALREIIPDLNPDGLVGGRSLPTTGTPLPCSPSTRSTAGRRGSAPSSASASGSPRSSRAAAASAASARTRASTRPRSSSTRPGPGPRRSRA